MDPLIDGCYLIYVILKNRTCGRYEMVGHLIHVVYVLMKNNAWWTVWGVGVPLKKKKKSHSRQVTDTDICYYRREELGQFGWDSKWLKNVWLDHLWLATLEF